MKKRGKLIFASLLVLLFTMSIGLNTMAAYVYNEEESRYVYNETDKDEVSITVTVSYDGMPIMGQDKNTTVLAGLPVTIPYFDLVNYDEYALDTYYRYPTLSDGSYNGAGGTESVIKRPTALHMVIYLLERYYLGVPEEECGTGQHEAKLVAAEESKRIMNFLSDIAYETEDRSGLYVSGSPRSLYMTNFWGHTENLNYYLNHEFPLEKPNWGSTCDYITLEDGDVIDIAMFSNWDFYSMENSGFAYFENGEETIGIGESFVINKIKRAEKGVVDGATTVVEKDAFELYDYYVIDPEGNPECLKEDVETGLSSITLNGFDEPGTYYVYAVDTNGHTSDACRAPAVVKVNVVGDTDLASVTAPAPVTGVKNGTAMTVEALGLPTQTKVKTVTDYIVDVDITWDLSNVEYNPESVAAQTFTVKGNVELPSYIMANGISTEVQVTVSVDEAEVLTTVRNLIDAIGTVSYTSDSKSKIDAAREAYDALTSEGKELVAAKLSVLTAAEAAYAVLEADHEAAADASSLIDAIGTVSYTSTSKAKIDKARAAYDGLNANAKAYVSEARKNTLTAAESNYASLKKAAEEAAAKKAADQAAAEKAGKVIDAIGTVSYTSTSKSKIDAARSAYNALSADEKAYVSEARKNALTAAESNYATLKKNAEEAAKKAAEIEAAKKAVQETTIAKLKAKAKGSAGITLSWSKNTKVDGYEVWRSTKANSGYKKVTTINKNSTKTYTLKKGLKKSTTYYYRVRGYKVINGETVYTPYTRIIVNLNKSKAIKAISTSGVTYKTSNKKVTLTWSGHESMYSLKGYKIYQSTKSNKGFKAVKTTSSKKVTISKGLKKGKTYYFKIRGYAKVGKKTVYTKYSKVIKVKVK